MSRGPKTRILGRGKVGKALHAQLRAAGVDSQLVRGRSTGAPGRDLEVWVLALPDGLLADAAQRIAPRLSPRHSVLHCAGALDSEVLAACRDRGAAVAGFHPLASFVDPRHPPRLRGCTFVAQGDGRALRVARRLARALGARCVTGPLLGPAYHAAAAAVANGSAALGFRGTELLVSLGLPRQEAERALSALLRTVADNIATAGTPRALSGPVVRGDVQTVAAHLKALRAQQPAAAAAYRALLPLIVDCARAAGLPEGMATDMLRAARTR